MYNYRRNASFGINATNERVPFSLIIILVPARLRSPISPCRVPGYGSSGALELAPNSFVYDALEFNLVFGVRSLSPYLSLSL